MTSQGTTANKLVSLTILCYEIDIFMCCLFSETTVALTVFVLLGNVVTQ